MVCFLLRRVNLLLEGRFEYLSRSSSEGCDLRVMLVCMYTDLLIVPIKPFLGVVGLAHEAAGEFSTIPPYETGGNIDTKHIVQGSTLYLPVKVKGALFSCGDGHAAQGDGER